MSWVFVEDLKRASASLICSMKDLLLFDPPEVKIIGNMLSVLNQIYGFFLVLLYCSLHLPRSLTKYFFQLFHPMLLSLTPLQHTAHFQERDLFLCFRPQNTLNTVRLQKDFLKLKCLDFLREALSLAFGLFANECSHCRLKSCSIPSYPDFS